jgi:predicted GNAT family N-acyltransferase
LPGPDRVHGPELRIIAFREPPGVAPSLPVSVSEPASAAEQACIADRAMALRRGVFVDEQGVDARIEFDGLDAEALHLAAVGEGEVLGVLRLLFEGDRVRLGRMAVRGDRRSTGVGERLAHAAIDCARRCGVSEIYLHAQKHAVSFYAGVGFESVGPEFLEAGIAHVPMRRMLAVTGDPA